MYNGIAKTEKASKVINPKEDNKMDVGYIKMMQAMAGGARMEVCHCDTQEEAVKMASALSEVSGYACEADGSTVYTKAAEVIAAKQTMLKKAEEQLAKIQ